MTQYSKIFLTLCLFLVGACAAPTGTSTTATGTDDFGSDTMTKVASTACISGETLTENNGFTTTTLNNIATTGTLVGFTGSSNCVLNSSYNERWTDGDREIWFSLDLQSNACLYKGSVWRVSRVTFPTINTVDYLMNRVDVNDGSTVEISGDTAVSGSYPYDKVGLRVFSCQ